MEKKLWLLRKRVSFHFFLLIQKINSTFESLGQWKTLKLQVKPQDLATETQIDLVLPRSRRKSAGIIIFRIWRSVTLKKIAASEGSLFHYTSLRSLPRLHLPNQGIFQPGGGNFKQSCGLVNQ